MSRLKSAMMSKGVLGQVFLLCLCLGFSCPVFSLSNTPTLGTSPPQKADNALVNGSGNAESLDSLVERLRQAVDKRKKAEDEVQRQVAINPLAQSQLADQVIAFLRANPPPQVNPPPSTLSNGGGNGNTSTPSGGGGIGTTSGELVTPPSSTTDSSTNPGSSNGTPSGSDSSSSLGPGCQQSAANQPVTCTVNPQDPKPIQSAIARLPAQGGTVTIPAGTFTVGMEANDDHASLPSNVTLQGAGMDKTILKLKDNSPAFVDTAVVMVEDVNHVNISNLSIDGNVQNQSHAKEQFYGIELLTVNGKPPTHDVNIQNVHIYNSFGDAILASYNGTYNVLIQGCTLENSGRNEITIDSGYNLTIKNNTLRKDQRASGAFGGLFGIDIGDDQRDISHVYIMNNTLDYSKWPKYHPANVVGQFYNNNNGTDVMIFGYKQDVLVQNNQKE